VIRAATPGDLDAILRLQADSFEAAQWSREAWSDTLGSAGPRRCLVAEFAAQVAALLLYQDLLDGETEILNLAVDPASRRRGLASALLERLISSVPGAILLEVREDNVAALALYRQYGFERVGRRPQYYHHPVGDALLLRRG
jgi:ribosomal-protein-alanine N-acetyltransferase